MLPKKHRLPGYIIPQLIKKGKRYSNDIASVIVMPSEDNTDLKGTVIVPVRLSKKAVLRNRTKRLLREAIFQQLPAMQSGFYFIVMAKKIFNEEKLSDIESDIASLLSKIQLIN